MTRPSFFKLFILALTVSFASSCAEVLVSDPIPNNGEPIGVLPDDMMGIYFPVGTCSATAFIHTSVKPIVRAGKAPDLVKNKKGRNVELPHTTERPNEHQESTRTNIR